MIDLTVLFPAYNEADRITAAITSAVDLFQDYTNEVEIMLVENGSDDETYAAAGRAFLDAVGQYGSAANNISYTALQSKPGKGAAIKYGVARAAGRYILISDVDMAAPLYQVAHLMTAEADLAIGSRRLPGAEVSGLGLGRRITSAVFAALAWPLTPWIKDTQCGFKLLRAEAARKLMPLITLDGYAFDVELIHAAIKNKMRVAEVPVIWKHDNRSKVNAITDSFMMAIDLATIYANTFKGWYAL